MRRKIIRLTTSFLLPIMACTQGAAAQDTAAQDAAIQQTSAQKMHEYYVISAPLTDLLVQIARDVDLEIEFDSEKQVYVTSTHLSGTDTELIAQLNVQNSTCRISCLTAPHTWAWPQTKRRESCAAKTMKWSI